MFDNSHYLKTRAEMGKTYVAQAFEELYYGKSHKTGLK